MSHDHGSQFPEILVTAGVIGMPVGIENKPDRLIRQLGDHLPNRIGQGGILVIHEERAVFSDA